MCQSKYLVRKGSICPQMNERQQVVYATGSICSQMNKRQQRKPVIDST